MIGDTAADRRCIVLYRHLTGRDALCRDVVGFYPMCTDETCFFPALDFDDDGWQAAVCEAQEISYALERFDAGTHL